MGLMDKFKNLFTEEVEEEKPIKKEVRHVEIPSPKKEPEKKTTPVVEKKDISDSTAIKKEEKFVFPVYFDDKDFDDLEKPKKEIKKEKKVESKSNDGAYKGTLRRESYSEEKKSFKPSLIISPVYGVLDKNYHKDDIIAKEKVTHSDYYKNPVDMTVDDIRDKAYGTLEDELKNNILGNEEFKIEKKENTETAIDLFNELDFDELDKKEENKLDKNGDTSSSLLFEDSSIDDDTAILTQQLEEQKRKLDQINDYIQENTVEKKSEIIEPEEIEKNEELNDEINGNQNEENVESENIDLNENEMDPNLTESELFNLIDSMYEDKEEK